MDKGRPESACPSAPWQVYWLIPGLPGAAAAWFPLELEQRHSSICPCKRHQGPQLTLRMIWGHVSALWSPSLILTDIGPIIHLIASHTLTSAAAKLFALGLHYCYQT